MMRFDILTLFPQIVAEPFRHSLMGKGIERGIFSYHVHDLRQYTDGRHRVCDDAPFGGGEGMVMKVEPIARAVNAIKGENARAILMSPAGAIFSQSHVQRLLAYSQLVFVCGHYEGVDERVSDQVVDEELSIGDFVLTGGELAAMVIVEAVARRLDGVVRCAASLSNESFERGLLDCPHYTRPRTFQQWAVPDVLLSGNHAQIARWRRREAMKRTLQKRPDLLERVPLDDEERIFVDELKEKR